MKIRNALLMSALLLTQGAWAQTVKVGTFNVRLSSNGDWIADANTPNAWPERKDGFVQVFRSLDVDVWGLQEVCPDQTAYFEKHLPEWEFVGDYRMADRKSGEASSVAFKKDRFEVIEKGTFWLSETPDVPGSMSWNTAFPRVCSYAFLKDRRTGVKFCFANTHLDHKSGEARRRGIELIVQRMKKIGNGVPIIFTGDHNCTRNDEPAKIARTLLKDAADITEKPDPGPHRTYHNWGDPKCQSRIDYIYVSDGIRVLDYATRDDRCPGTDLYPSDHFPIVATLEFPAHIGLYSHAEESQSQECIAVFGGSFSCIKPSKVAKNAWKNAFGVKVLNFGKGGMGFVAGADTTNDIPNQVKRALAKGESYRAFILWASTNDIWRHTVQEQNEAIERCVLMIRAAQPESKIVLFASMPLPLQPQANELLAHFVEGQKETCRELDVPCLDLYSESGITAENAHLYTGKDRFHPNEAGYAKVSDLQVEFLRRYVFSTTNKRKETKK